MVAVTQIMAAKTRKLAKVLKLLLWGLDSGMRGWLRYLLGIECVYWNCKQTNGCKSVFQSVNIIVKKVSLWERKYPYGKGETVISLTLVLH